jgi:hypothetical protein
MAKRSNKIEPLDIDEMFNSPSLDGMLSFRDVAPAAVERFRTIKSLETPERPTPRSTLRIEPIGMAPIDLTPIGAMPIGHSDADLLNEENPQPQFPLENELQKFHSESGPSESDILAELKNAPQPPISRGKLVRALKVEDGHSNNENSLYWYLWRSGRHVKNSKSRFLQAGYAQLSKAIGVDRTNVQNMLRFLESKVSIRILTPGTVRSATVYEIFSCEQILVRRNELGLLWVRKFGSRRVDFVEEPAGYLTPTGVTPIGLTPPPGVTPTPPVGVTPTPPVGVTPPLLVIESNEVRTTTTTPPGVFASQLRTLNPAFDDAAASRLWAECNMRSPDCTSDEIVHFVNLKLDQLRRNRNIINPIGMVLTSVPSYFSGTAIDDLRSIRKRETDELAAAEAETRKYWQSLINSTTTPEEDRELARKMLLQDSEVPDG